MTETDNRFLFSGASYQIVRKFLSAIHAITVHVALGNTQFFLYHGSFASTQCHRLTIYMHQMYVNIFFYQIEIILIIIKKLKFFKNTFCTIIQLLMIYVSFFINIQIRDEDVETANFNISRCTATERKCYYSYTGFCRK